MAVHGCPKPVLYENGDDSDDGAPVVFKRTNTPSKQSQLNSSSKKSSLNHEQTQERPTSNQSIGNGESTSLQKNKVKSNAKVSTEKAAAVSSNSRASTPSQPKDSSKSGLSNSNTNSFHTKKSCDDVEISDDFDDNKPLRATFAVQKSNATNPLKMVECPLENKMESENEDKMVLDKSCVESEESDDSEDALPLSAKFPSSLAARQKVSTSRITKLHEPSMPTSTPSQKNKASIKDSADDSEDEKSLIMLASKSTLKSESEKKPLASKLKKNDTAKESSSDLKSPSIKDSADDSEDEKSLIMLALKSTLKSESEKKPLASKLKKNGTAKESSSDLKSPSIKDSADDSEDEKSLIMLASKSTLKSESGKKTLASKLKNNDTAKESSSDLKSPSIKDSADDSEVEKSLIMLASKSTLKSESEKKPLTSKLKKNDTDKESSCDLKSPKSMNKRPSGDIISATSSSSKKAKLSDISVPGKVKSEASVKKEEKVDDNDHITITQKNKKAVSSDSQSSTKKMTKKITSLSLKKDSKKMTKTMKNSKYSKSLKVPPGSGEGKKWTTLEHNGVIFPPPYKSHGIKMLYNGQPVDLTPEQEEVATMFAVMKDSDYATKPKFIENFMNDWQKILGKNHIIKKFELCDFTPIYEWHLAEKEKKKQMTSEEKKTLKEEKLKQEEEYMWAVVDGVKEKVGNFRVEPPGLFRGRGEHPKMGKLKRRIRPKDITINVGKDAPVPQCPIPGERWKEVKHDNTVTWLAFWNDPINPKEFKYVFLAASSSLKGQSDKEKYEKARLLKDYIQGIRTTYTRDFTSKDTTRRQIAVATYLIDKLALRAGNEKDDDEADTVGCCTLKVENVTCVPPNKLQFDFLGKDSVRYFNTVEVELSVYKAIGEFQTAKTSDGKKKAGGDDLFDMLDTNKLNAHLKELMPGLTAKVFRTYNASITLDDMLNKETKHGTLAEKIAVYQSANKEVAIICNHQRSVSKSHDAQMSRLNEKIDELKAQKEELKVDLSRARKGKPPLKDKDGKPKKNLSPEVLEKKLSQVDAKVEKMELDKKIKEDLKTVALGTSKINYLDPRISVAWCKRHEVPIEKIFNKSLLSKFAWAMDVEPSYRF